jgi:hypothetical protein
MSSAGTAQEATTRRGSHSSTALVLSTTTWSSTAARMRFAEGS